MELKKLMEHISIIPDYRQAWKVEHKLSDILLLTICAVISGAEGWEDIEDFGETHLDFLKQYGDFENGIPVHDTIARVVSCISPAKFHECFINWMRDCHSSDDKDVIAIDGKTLRHSYDKSRRRGAIHVISAFSTMHSLVIGQIKTDEKSNEITAIPELLNMLDIKGKIITTDAMGCQKDIAEKIQKQGGDYLFAVKGNQGRLNKAFEEKFPLKELNNPEHDSYAMSEKSHGREIFFLAVEQRLPLNGQNGASDTMLRASASFFNGGKYSDEWHPNGSGWFAQNLYLDAAQYIRQDIQAWTADYRVSWHQKVANGQTIEPYAHVQDNGYRDKGTQGAQLGGVGVRWNIWTGETHYDAWPHKVSLGVEYQHTFKAINQRNGERNNAFLTIGVHW